MGTGDRHFIKLTCQIGKAKSAGSSARWLADVRKKRPGCDKVQLSVEIVFTHDDFVFSHRGVGGDHLAANVKISVLQKGCPKQILSVLTVQKLNFLHVFANLCSQTSRSQA